jgi:hypothetical protein
VIIRSLGSHIPFVGRSAKTFGAHEALSGEWLGNHEMLV